MARNNPTVVRLRRPRSEDNDDFSALFDVEPFLRNQVTKPQMDHLRNRIDSEGLKTVAKDIGIDQMTLLRVCAGFGHRLVPATATLIREYLNTMRKGR